MFLNKGFAHRFLFINLLIRLILHNEIILLYIFIKLIFIDLISHTLYIILLYNQIFEFKTLLFMVNLFLA